MAQGHRPDRVGEEIRHELSDLLSRGAVHDPGIGFITLTRVKVTPDLQIARVFYTTMGDEAAKRQTADALERATPFFRRQIGGRLRLRRVPELEFRFDQSVVNQDRIEQILRELHEEEAQRAGATESADSKDTVPDAGSKEQDPPYNSRSGGSQEQDPPYTDEENR
jgi:ribosome-binding factor A